MKPNWQEDNYITDQSYKEIEYYGSLDSEFEVCTFENILFYWNLFNFAEFKKCTFKKCTFAGVSFCKTNFIKCTFYSCNFTKSNIGSHCIAENSYAIDCIIDKQSAENNPLTIQQEKDTKLVTKTLKKQLYNTFTESRPKLAVDDPKHCLSCDETQETHEKLTDLKELTVDHFNVCYMSVEAFSEGALIYYMPKLLELLLLGKENDWDSFQNGFLEQLVPNKFGNRFQNYTKEQIKCIVKILKLFYNKYNRIEETWDYEKEMVTDNSMYKEPLAYCKDALDFWNKK